ncbi:PDDEXK nuclease domain-containing protein [Brevifollis gellanilyticus]|uniref:Cytoplasmic protein n=1 Tax=Brevifollis gellanilyticus TaxID=748831 RepID=A0A512MHA8_9BACT|nr:PDDEXK nuclease domain-containing protein [Brevifollis gellanilyticus]GEP46120.1 hypothetical protein BGE01nite_54110 [Brevifollis gellanilyticus]
MKKAAAKKAPSRARTPVKAKAKAEASLSFTKLVQAIQHVHTESTAVVNRVVNTTLTLRNWVIGWYLITYEQEGSDRAKYGESVIDRVAERLATKGLDELTSRYLRLCRQFTTVYPQIWRSLTAKSDQMLVDSPIWRSLTAKSTFALPASTTGMAASSSAEIAIRESLTPELGAPTHALVSQLSFTHLEQLLAIDDPLKRAFYEIECIRGNWSVRDLKRQIGSLYFERSGLSKDKAKLAKMVKAGVECAEPKLTIRDPYIFEFLGLRAKDAMAENDLEAALIEHLREFLLELGHGFCLEAQQKSILIGKTRGFVDLVFYHRLLKCHVLVELKVQPFAHEHLGQLNTYVTWYKKHMMAAGDNAPVGLLLCTGKDHALVEYATASMDNQLFVSKYAVGLPSKEELQRFLDRQRKELAGKV